MDNTNWAKNEIALAITSEKEAARGTDEWKYGAACFENALKAYNVIVSKDHSETSAQITKNILNRLIDGKCLTPIYDTPDVWNDITWDKGNGIKYQCKRMSSLFKDVSEKGETTYTDINRVQCIDIDDPNNVVHNSIATKLVDKIFPITMPYLPNSKPFRLFRETFLFDPKNGDYDTEVFLYLLMPNGRKLELNRYFKEDKGGNMVPIEQKEFDERKMAYINRKGKEKKNDKT